MATLLNQLYDVGFASHVCFSHVLNVYSPSLILPYLQISFVCVK